MFPHIFSVIFFSFLLINKDNCEVTTRSTTTIASPEDNCSIYNSINITSAIPISVNKPITHNGIVYPPAEYFLTDKDYNYITKELTIVKQHTRGCLCNLVNCIRLCCPINHIENSKQRGCFLKENLQLPDYDKLIAKQGIIIGRPCKTMFELLPDEYKLHDDGVLENAFDLTNYTQEMYCLTPLHNDEDEIILSAYLCEDAISNYSDIAQSDKRKYEYYPYGKRKS